MPCCNAGRAICGQEGATVHQRTKGYRELSFLLKYLLWIHTTNYASFLCFTKTSRKDRVLKNWNLLLHKNLFHISKAFISAFTVLFAILCFVLKSYKTKIWLFYNSWHVMFSTLGFSLDKESDYTVQFCCLGQRVFIFLWKLRI